MKFPVSSFSSTKKGFTLVELLVVIIIIVSLMGITFVVVFKGRDSTDNAQCVSNLRELWSAGLKFSNDFNGRLPSNGMDDNEDTVADESKGWMVAIAPYLYGSDIAAVPLLDDKFRCVADRMVRKYEPGTKVKASFDSVSYVPWTDGSDDLDNPQSPINMARGYHQSDVAWLSDGEGLPTNKNIVTASDFEEYVQPAVYRHKDKINVLYVGGTIKSVEKPTFETVSPGGATKKHLVRN